MIQEVKKINITNDFAIKFLEDEISAVDYILSQPFKADEHSFKKLMTIKREVYEKSIEALKNQLPCDLCVYNPPSSGDGKPCVMCTAEGRCENGN